MELPEQKKSKKHRKSSKQKCKKEKEFLEAKSSSEDEIWVERKDCNTISSMDIPSEQDSSLTIQREEWLQLPGSSNSSFPAEEKKEGFLSTILQHSSQRVIQPKDKAVHKESANILDLPGSHSRELNPYWKDGGSGLPLSGMQESSSRQNSSVGDGGRSWLLKSYKRALELTERGMQSFREIAEERWGSVDNLYKLLREAGINPADPDKALSELTSYNIVRKQPSTSVSRHCVQHFSQSKKERYAGPVGQDDSHRHRKSDHRHEDDRGHREDNSGCQEEGRKHQEEDRRHQEEGRRHQEEGRRHQEEGRRHQEEGGRHQEEGRRHREEGRKHQYTDSQQNDVDRRYQDVDRRYQDVDRRYQDVDRRYQDVDRRYQGVDRRYSETGLGRRSRFAQPEIGEHSPQTSLQSSTTYAWRKKDGGGAKNMAKMEDNHLSKISLIEGVDSLKPAHMLSSVPETSREGSSAISRETTLTLSSSEEVSDDQLNALSAKIVKAELLGNAEKAERLKLELKSLQEQKEKTEQNDKMVILTKPLSRGQVMPASLAKHPHPSGKGKRRKQEYFESDERSSIREMLHQERLTSFDDTQALIAKMASKFVPSEQSGEVVDDALDSRSSRSYDVKRSEDRENRSILRYSKKMTQVLESCYLCFGSKSFKKHLVISVGQNVYLSLPSRESLVEHHCLLSPLEHVSCSPALDENVWEEMRSFQKALARMFADHGKEVVFLESHTDHRRQHHMCIECIPLGLDVGQTAPMYFKKAILESEEEWSVNKKLVELKLHGTRGAIPNGLPFFAIEFGIGSGFAHVIEDRQAFPFYFGKEVIGGMLDVEPKLWKNPRVENFAQQKKKVLGFAEWWNPFDISN